MISSFLRPTCAAIIGISSTVIYTSIVVTGAPVLAKYQLISSLAVSALSTCILRYGSRDLFMLNLFSALVSVIFIPPCAAISLAGLPFTKATLPTLSAGIISQFIGVCIASTTAILLSEHEKK